MFITDDFMKTERAMVRNARQPVVRMIQQLRHNRTTLLRLNIAASSTHLLRDTGLECFPVGGSIRCRVRLICAFRASEIWFLEAELY